MITRFLSLFSVLCVSLALPSEAHSCTELADTGSCINRIDWGEVILGSSDCASFHPTNDVNDHGFPITISYSISGPGAQGVSLSPGCNETVPDGARWGGCTFSWKADSLGQWTTIVDFSVQGSGPNGSFSTSCSTLVTSTVVAPPANFDPTKGIPDTLPPVVQNVSASGTSTSLSVGATMRFDPGMAGQQGSVFIGARVPPYATATGLSNGQPRSISETRQPFEAGEQWYVNNGSGWNQYLGGGIPAKFTGLLNDAAALVSILNGADSSGLCGTELWVGYGANDSAMLANNTLGRIYTVLCNYAFSAVSGGDASNLSLEATVQVATADSGKNGYYYVGRLQNSQWWLHNGSGWEAYGGGSVPAYASAPLTTRQIRVFNNENVQPLVGGQIYVGYGTSDTEMLGNNRYGLVYTVR